MIAFNDNPDERSGGLPSQAVAPASVSMLVDAGLPLDLGLRALSEDVPSRRLRRVLARMSDELAAGNSPEDVLSHKGRGLPRYIRGLIKAGVQTGQLGTFLGEFLLILVRRNRTRLALGLLLLFGLLVLLPGLAIAGTFFSSIILQFQDIYNDFGVELPAVTLLVLNLAGLMSPSHLLMALGVLLIIGLLITAIRILLGPPAWTRGYQKIPLIGTNSRMRAFSEFCSLLGLLVSGHVPLPDALAITAGALKDANLRAGSRKLAARVADGESLYEGASGLVHFPPELRNLFRWENRGAAFGEMLRQAGVVFAARSRVQLGLLWLILPPLALMFVGSVLALTVIGLFMPLIKLLNELS